jgi:hypothetical protein
VYNNLDPKVFQNSITLEFNAPAFQSVRSGGRLIGEHKSDVTQRWNEEYFRRKGDTVYVTLRPNAILEFE